MTGVPVRDKIIGAVGVFLVFFGLPVLALVISEIWM